MIDTCIHETKHIVNSRTFIEDWNGHIRKHTIQGASHVGESSSHLNIHNRSFC